MEIQESKQIQLISDIKDKIKAAQYRALLNVNEQLREYESFSVNSY